MNNLKREIEAFQEQAREEQRKKEAIVERARRIAHIRCWRKVIEGLSSIPRER